MRKTRGGKLMRKRVRRALGVRRLIVALIEEEIAEFLRFESLPWDERF